MSKKPLDVKGTEVVGKAIPNDFSKWTAWTSKIPVIGQILSAIGGIDAGATAYSDIYQEGKEKGYSTSESRMKAIPISAQAGGSTFMGQGSDPGRYGSQGQKIDPSWQNYMMNVGNLWGSYQGGNLGGMYGSGTNLYNDISGKGNYGTDVWGSGNAGQATSQASGGGMDLGSMFGGGTGSMGGGMGNMGSMGGLGGMLGGLGQQNSQGTEKTQYQKFMEDFQRKQEQQKQQQALQALMSNYKQQLPMQYSTNTMPMYQQGGYRGAF